MTARPARSLLRRAGLFRLGRWTACHRAAIASAALIAAAILAVYSRLVFEGLVLGDYDVQTYFFPYWSHTFASIRAGELPLWNPHLFLGAPFLANPQAALLYALNWLLIPLGPDRALGIALVLHVALAAAGVVALARGALGLGWPAATTAAIVFAFGGFFAGQSGHINQVSAAAWLPWLLLGLDGMLAGRRVWWAVTPVIVALTLLAGHPQAAYIALVFAFVYALVTAAARRTPGRWSWPRAIALGLAAWVAALVGGVLLSAAQLLPTLELSHQSIRAHALTIGDAASFSLPMDQALLGLLPPFLVVPTSTEFLGYVGTAGIALATLGLISRYREPRAWLFAVVAALAVLLAAGPATPLFGAAHRVVPGFDLFRVPPRWMLLSLLGGALLAGYGAEALASVRGWSSVWAALARWLGALGVLVALGLGFALTQPDLPGGVGLAWLLAGVLGLVVLTLAFVADDRRLRWVAPVVVAAELVTAGWTSAVRVAIPDVPYQELGAVLPGIRANTGGARVLSLTDVSFEINQPDRAVLATRWREQIGHPSWREFRVALKNRDILSPNLALAYGLRTADGYDGGVLPLANYIDLRDALIPGSAARPDTIIFNELRTLPSDRVLDTLGVQTVIQDRERMLEFEGAHLDLRFSRWVDRPLEFESLGLRDVNGVMIVANGDAAGVGGHAGAIELAGARADTSVPINRSPAHAQRLAIGPGHLVASRPGLDEPAFLSTARLPEPRDIERITISPAGGAFDLYALTVLHESGESTAILLRNGAPAVARAVGDVSVTARARPRARAWVPRTIRVAPDSVAANRGVSSVDFDPDAEAWLVAGPDRAEANGLQGIGRRVLDVLRTIGVASPPGPVGHLSPGEVIDLRAALEPSDGRLRSAGGSVSVREDRAEKLVLDVDTEGAAVLVVPDAMYPGWTARVDGVDAAVWQANLAQRAVLIPAAGAHVVEFQYRSVPFEVGRVVSLATLGVGILAGGLWWRRRRSA